MASIMVLFSLLLLSGHAAAATGTAVLRLKHKFADKTIMEFDDHILHDNHRHSKRFHSTLSFPVGGIQESDPNMIALYYAQVSLGTPAVDYYLQIDTGSDITWITCDPCLTCPRTDILGGDLKLYDPRKSATSSSILCRQPFCDDVMKYQSAKCHHSESCPYHQKFGDNSGSWGYFTTDKLHLDAAGILNTSLHFGCSLRQSNKLQVTNGILGLGRHRISAISQLVASGITPNSFAHCLEGSSPGGTLIIGHIVEPNIKLIPMLPHQNYYLVNLLGADIGNSSVSTANDLHKSNGRQGALIDSGTSLGYLPDEFFTPLITKIMAVEGVAKQNMKYSENCFLYNGSVDNIFPVVSLKFEGSATMEVYPRDYLLHFDGNIWCMGWKNSKSDLDNKDFIAILGDMVLKNKLVVYNSEKRQIGWKSYDCLSNVTVWDEKYGYRTITPHTVDPVLAPYVAEAKSVKTKKGHFLFSMIFTIFILYF